MGADGRGIEAHMPRPQHGVGQSLRGLRGEENPRRALLDGFQGSALLIRDHGPPAGHGLHRGNAEVLLLGKKEGRAVLVEFPQSRVALPAQEFHGRFPGQLLKSRILGPHPGNLEQDVEPAARRYGQIHALVGNQPAGYQVVGLRTRGLDRGKAEEIGIHGRIDDVSVPAVGFLDPLPDVLAVGHEKIDVPAGFLIPTHQIGAQPFGSLLEPFPGSVGEIVVELVVDIAHGGMAVADVQRRLPAGAPGYADAFGHAVAE